jgi:hypothetical protein
VGQVRSEEPHALALPAMVGMRPQEAQVVVRRMSGVICVEAVQEGQHVVRMRADQLAKQRFDSRFVLIAEFRLTWRDPKRGGTAIVCHPNNPYGSALCIKSSHQMRWCCIRVSGAGNVQLHVGSS